ncbi:Sir2 family NAD-dependent protein deacetylase [Moraxella sp. ZY210820]|uniref:SIR2 family NAD-dependent protein deacylase n=1 Tax=unclassified Moraxella TaxID=2685852 RepID=UPI0027307845|nr:Sir2 family NAD-dependent protein deacetylase [Moraxella sp. ZY210820]WLF83145.1 NAD-dependent deacetylase [Moraxella sp. ZY210820]
MSQSMQQRIKQLIHSADGLLITAGAGMGVDSGLPDFRGNQGMWQAYPALGRKKMDFTQIANPQAFRQQPRLAWGFYGHRLDLYRKTQPHDGFYLLQKLIKQQQLDYFIFTSNVDGQFQKAGFDDDLIYECHGSIHHVQCSQPCQNEIWQADDLLINIDKENCQWLDDLPLCPHCQNAIIRPNILMFNDDYWLEQRSHQQAECLSIWLKKHHNPVVIEMGAGTAIPTVRLFSEQFSPNLIRINPREAQLPKQGGVALNVGAKAGIDIIVQALSL